MKPTLRVALAILAAFIMVGVWAWNQRFELALDHLRRDVEGSGMLEPVAWGVLDDFHDRRELEVFVRGRIVELAAAPPASLFGIARLLDLAEDVYLRQPEHVDAPIIAAALMLECRLSCIEFETFGSGPPTFYTGYWADHEGSETLRMAMRLAAIQLAALRAEDPDPYRDETTMSSFMALADTLAEIGAGPDPELAKAVGLFMIGDDPVESETEWLTAALERIAGPQGAAPAWIAGLVARPNLEPNNGVWSRAVESLAASVPPNDEAIMRALVSRCVLRSDLPESVDEACIDLGLAWGPVWSAHLEAEALADKPEAVAVRALFAAHERERKRTWQSVISDWREAEPSPPDQRVATIRGERTSVVRIISTQSPLGRAELRDVDRLIAAEPAALPAIEAHYNGNQNLRVVAAAALALAKRGPQTLSSAVMDHIDRFRPLALALEVDSANFDAAAYFQEGGRVALGLIALDQNASGSARIYPLILTLSLPDEGFTDHAAEVLRRTLTADEFADGLFGFLVVRDRYLVSEVAAYREMLTFYGKAVSGAVELNLAQLLTLAGGRPEDVPWIFKLIGISALAKIGESTALPLLDRYAADTDIYLAITTRTDRYRRSDESIGERYFYILVDSAVVAISNRARIGEG